MYRVNKTAKEMLLPGTSRCVMHHRTQGYTDSPASYRPLELSFIDSGMVGERGVHYVPLLVMFQRWEFEFPGFGFKIIAYEEKTSVLVTTLTHKMMIDVITF